MGLYRRLFEERAEEVQRRGGALPPRRGLDSKVLVRRLVHAPQGRSKYIADLATIHRLIARGPRNAGESVRLGSLKAKYPKEYGQLRTERQGQEKLL